MPTKAWTSRPKLSTCARPKLHAVRRGRPRSLTIDDGECNRCMHCINLMPKALRLGKERGATILVGGKAPIVHGALLSWVIVPFMKIEPPYD